MGSFEEYRKEQLKDPVMRFWWYFYEPYYMYRTARIKITAIMRRRKCCRKRRKM